MDYYDAGYGTTPGMWEMLSDILAEREEKLPVSLNAAIYALRDGDAVIVTRDGSHEHTAD